MSLRLLEFLDSRHVEVAAYQPNVPAAVSVHAAEGMVPRTGTLSIQSSASVVHWNTLHSETEERNST
jgi:hypothetical protein